MSCSVQHNKKAGSASRAFQLQSPICNWSLIKVQLLLRRTPFCTQEKLTLPLSPQKAAGTYALCSWSCSCEHPGKAVLWNWETVQGYLALENCWPLSDLQAVSLICLGGTAKISACCGFFSLNWFFPNWFPLPCVEKSHLLAPKPGCCHFWHWRDSTTALDRLDP